MTKLQNRFFKNTFAVYFASYSYVYFVCYFVNDILCIKNFVKVSDITPQEYKLAYRKIGLPFKIEEFS